MAKEDKGKPDGTQDRGHPITREIQAIRRMTLQGRRMTLQGRHMTLRGHQIRPVPQKGATWDEAEGLVGCISRATGR